MSSNSPVSSRAVHEGLTGGDESAQRPGRLAERLFHQRLVGDETAVDDKNVAEPHHRGVERADETDLRGRRNLEVRGLAGGEHTGVAIQHPEFPMRREELELAVTEELLTAAAAEAATRRVREAILEVHDRARGVVACGHDEDRIEKRVENGAEHGIAVTDVPRCSTASSHDQAARSSGGQGGGPTPPRDVGVATVAAAPVPAGPIHAARRRDGRHRRPAVVETDSPGVRREPPRFSRPIATAIAAVIFPSRTSISSGALRPATSSPAPLYPSSQASSREPVAGRDCRRAS